jgi:hypothetical protein
MSTMRKINLLLQLFMLVGYIVKAEAFHAEFLVKFFLNVLHSTPLGQFLYSPTCPKTNNPDIACLAIWQPVYCKFKDAPLGLCLYSNDCVAQVAGFQPEQCF